MINEVTRVVFEHGRRTHYATTDARTLCGLSTRDDRAFFIHPSALAPKRAEAECSTCRAAQEVRI